MIVAETRAVDRGRPIVAACIGAPIGFVGGLIGLGGSEFRLPFLVGLFRYATRAAVPLNLAMSLITVGAGLGAKMARGPLGAESVVGVIAAMIGGGVVGAYIGAASVAHIRESSLRHLVEWLLMIVGVCLICEGVVGWQTGILFQSSAVALTVAAGLGAIFGVLRSLLGIAGGEVVIPALVLFFGVNIKLAGTASQIISLPTVAVGLWRYRRAGLLGEPADWLRTVVPMGLASAVGAIGGAAFVAYVPADALKIALGLALIGSAFKVFRRVPVRVTPLRP
jgi:uncharacterized membrane protein YfcA